MATKKASPKPKVEPSARKKAPAGKVKAEAKKAAVGKKQSTAGKPAAAKVAAAKKPEAVVKRSSKAAVKPKAKAVVSKGTEKAKSPAAKSSPASKAVSRVKAPASKAPSKTKAPAAKTSPKAKTSNSKVVGSTVTKVTVKKSKEVKNKAAAALHAADVAEVKPASPAGGAVPAASGKKVKILSREFLLGLAEAIRSAVAPMTRDVKGREIVGTAVSGDATFELDRIAEKALLTYLKNARAAVAYYSEDSGYTTFSNSQPEHLLIVDPIDGTRAAKSGFENCVVAIASTRVIERPVMGDVDNACVMEILGDRVFYAERGKGVRVMQDGHLRRFKPGENRSLEELTWSMTVPGRPAELIFPIAAKLVDLTSLKGGFFACNSTSYSLTRLVTNQLDACVDVANRFYRDIPDLVRDHFINAGRGTVLGIEPYDLAAGLLVAQEAGCVVTDAYGKSLDDLLLLDTSVENQRSLVAASNKHVHEKILGFFDMRIRQWEELLRRRAEHAARLAVAQREKQ